MKCQALINFREELANIIDSFHYTEFKHNWPSGSLVPRVLKLKVLVLSCGKLSIYFQCVRVERFSDVSPRCVKGFARCSVYAFLKIKGKAGVLMMRNAWSISNCVYSYSMHLHQRPLSDFHNFTWHFLHISTDVKKGMDISFYAVM